MNPTECEKVLEELRAMMNLHEFDWVVAQVDEQIRLGKTEDVEVRMPRRSRVHNRQTEELVLFEHSDEAAPKGVRTILQQTRLYSHLRTT